MRPDSLVEVGAGGLGYAFNNPGFVGSNAGVVETSEEDWHRAARR